jgi:hypothetical protein
LEPILEGSFDLPHATLSEALAAWDLVKASLFREQGWRDAALSVSPAPAQGVRLRYRLSHSGELQAP